MNIIEFVLLQAASATGVMKATATNLRSSKHCSVIWNLFIYYKWLLWVL